MEMQLPPEQKPKKKTLFRITSIFGLALSVFLFFSFTAPDYMDSVRSGDFSFIINIVLGSLVATIVGLVFAWMRAKSKDKKLAILGTIIFLIIATIYIVYGSNKKPDTSFPFDNCPYLLQSYSDSVNTEEEARNLLYKWINSKFTKEEIGTIKIERIIMKDGSYFIELTGQLFPKIRTDFNVEEIGYMRYKVTGGQIFALSLCPK